MPDVDAVSIAAGGTYACALRRDARVACWGAGESPHIVEGIGDVAEVRVADSFACALHRNSTVSCWGGTAVRGLGSKRIRKLVAGGHGMVAIDGPGNVFAWGAPEWLPTNARADGIVAVPIGVPRGSD